MVGAETADDGRTGSWREGRVEEIDIETDVALVGADALGDGGDAGVHAVLVQPAGIEHRIAVGFVIVSAHADLD